MYRNRIVPSLEFLSTIAFEKTVGQNLVHNLVHFDDCVGTQSSKWGGVKSPICSKYLLHWFSKLTLSLSLSSKTVCTALI